MVPVEPSERDDEIALSGRVARPRHSAGPAVEDDDLEPFNRGVAAEDAVGKRSRVHRGQPYRGASRRHAGQISLASECRGTLRLRCFRRMGVVRAHAAVFGITAVAVLAVVGVFTFARPQYHPYVIPKPPQEPLPYTKVLYSTTQAQRAFKAADITLVRHTHEPVPVGAPPIVDLSNSGNIVIVDVFGDPQRVAASGFSDYFNFAHGHWLKAPTSCSPGANGAERWRGNVRVIVSCANAGTAAPLWLARTERALTNLPSAREPDSRRR
jgi:hypothetical protein